MQSRWLLCATKCSGPSSLIWASTFPFLDSGEWKTTITTKRRKKKRKNGQLQQINCWPNCMRTARRYTLEISARICCVEMPTTNVCLPVKPGELWPFRASAVISSWVRYLCTSQGPCFANAAFADRAGYKLGGYWMSTMLSGCWVTKKWFTRTSVNSTLNASGNRVQDLPYCSKFEGVNGITNKCYFVYSELGRKKQSKYWWEYSRELCTAGKTILWWMVENWRSKDPVDPFSTVRDLVIHTYIYKQLALCDSAFQLWN